MNYIATAHLVCFHNRSEPQTIECKAAVAWKAKEPLSFETIQVAPPKEGEIRLKVKDLLILYIRSMENQCSIKTL